jgi:hypothetical protein
MRITLPVYDGASQSYPSVLGSELINLQPYTPIGSGKSTARSLVPTPGFSDFTTSLNPLVGTVFKNELYVVQASGLTYKLYKVDSTGAETLIGDLGSSSRNITVPQFASNGEVLSILFPETDNYFYDPSTGLSQNTDAVYQGYEAEDTGVISVTSGDGYFIYCTTKKVFTSSLVTAADKGTSFDALDFATAEFSADDNVRVAWLKGELHVFGEETTEVWANVGGSGFPFQRIDGATIEKGLTYQMSLVEVDNSFMWVGRGEGESPAVWRATGGGGAQKVSNDYVDKLLIDYGSDDTYSGTGFSYSFNGNTVYGFGIANSSTEGDFTVLYDLIESARSGQLAWRRNFSRDTGSPSFKPFPFVKWELTNCLYVYDKVIFNGKYELTNDTFDADGDKVYRRFSSAYLQAQGEEVYVTRVEIRMKNATGDPDAADEVDRIPTVKMEISDDQGRTWVDYGSRNIGQSGKTRTQAVWSRGCGRSPNYRLFRFTTENRVETIFLDLVLDIERSTGR